MRQSSTQRRGRSRFQHAMHIARAVRMQIFIISGLAVASIVTLWLAMNWVTQGSWHDFLIGLSTNLLVAIIIFLLLEQGIKSLHPIEEVPEFPARSFIESMSQARRGERIRILETFVFLPNEHKRDFEAAILKTSARIEILLFHPHSEGAIKRAQQLNGAVNVEDETRKNLARFAKLQKEISKGRDNLEVRLYDALPSIAMYRVGKWAFASFFPPESRSDLSPNLKVPMDNPMGSYVDYLFKEIWNSTSKKSPTILLQQHMYLQIELPFKSSHTGANDRFAYNKKIDGEIDKDKCFVKNNNSALLDYLHNLQRQQKSENLIFHVDNRKWQGEPHLLSSIDPNEKGEFDLACQLIEQRYEEPHGTLNMDNTSIIRLQHIKEIP